MKHIFSSGSVVFAMFVAGTIAVQAQGQTFKGHLVDTVCADNHATEHGYAEKHENSCNLMATCVKSGYSLMTADHKVLKFDEKGAEKALALVKATAKKTDVKATVVGTLTGSTLTVQSIALD